MSKCDPALNLRADYSLFDCKRSHLPNFDLGSVVYEHGLKTSKYHTKHGIQECFMIKTSPAVTIGQSTFQVRWVFGNVSGVLRAQIVEFWLREGAVTNPYEAWRRSWEVACVLQEAVSNRVEGACTIAIRLDDHGVSYGFVRLYIRPASRRVGLNARLMETMIEGFKTMAHEPGAPRHLVATLENRKIERRAAQKIIARLGFVHVGTAATGELVMQCDLTARRTQLDE